MYSAGGDRWSSIIGQDCAAFEFWQKMKQTEFVWKHPELSASDWASTVPIGMHGDGGAYSKTDSLYAFTWNSLLQDGPSLEKTYLFTVVKKSDMVPETLDAVCDIFRFCMDVLVSGEFPTSNYVGREVAPRGALAGG